MVSIPEYVNDRVIAINSYLSDFITLLKETEQVDIVCDTQVASTNIVAIYTRYTEEVVRPAIKSGIIQNFKIISNTQLAILRVLPLEYAGSEDEEKMYNARFALNVAIRMIIEWHNLDEEKAQLILVQDRELAAFTSEHLKWLFLLDTRYQYPIFSNSHVWRLFFYLLRDRIKLS